MYERERPQISEKIGIIKETEEDFQNFSSTSKKFENTLNSQNKIKLLWNGSTEQESLQMKNNCLKIKQEIKKIQNAMVTWKDTLGIEVYFKMPPSN